MTGGRSAPRASVILATYRRPQVLPRAIRSVLDQTCGDWELLVVDDEPSAETARIVASFPDVRIRYVPHDRNRGLCAARNTGIRQARGEFIAFLDDDDMFLERKLETQATFLEAAPEGVGAVSSFEEILRPDGSMSIRAVTLLGDIHQRLLRDDLVRMQLLMVRRICFDRVGLFDERLRGHDDFDMTLRLSRGFQFATIGEPLVRIIATSGSMSTNLHDRIHAIETIMSTHPEFREGRRVRARWERRLARHHAELGDRRLWRRHLFRSLCANPASGPGWLALGAGSLFGSAAHLRLGRLRGRVEQARRAAKARIRKMRQAQ